MGRKIGFALIFVLLAAAGFTFNLWFPPLLIFMGSNGELVQGFSSLIQLLIWLGSLLVFWFGLLRKTQGKEPNDSAESENDKLEADQAHAALESKTRPKIEASGHATVVMGDQNKVTAPNSNMIEGNENMIINGSFNRITKNEPEIEPQALRQSYLNYLYETVCDVTLVGIDRNVAGDAESHVSLATVYTALETYFHQTKIEEKELKDRENQRQPVLEHLNLCPHLVLLGDPGSGKSTFVNYVALCLASEGLKKLPGMGGLTALLDEEQDKRKKSQKLSWECGSLLPYRVILRDFASGEFFESNEKDCANKLCAFIRSELAAANLDAFALLLFKEWQEQGGLLMLDGLDEVPEANEKRSQIKKVVEDFARAFPKCRILVTSRTYAYQKQDWALRGFEAVVLAPFNNKQIEWFVDHWYENIAQIRHQKLEDSQARASLLKNAIFSSDRLKGLAERPLLLTLMASLHAWRGGNLPEKREELYAETVDLMLVRWEDQRIIRGKNNEIKLIQPSLAEWMRSDRDQIRTLLNELAYRVHANQTELTGTADVPEMELVAGLMKINNNPDVNPVRLVEYLRDRAGLLLPRGVGVYTFPHRTFQEYLAACHLTELNYPVEVAQLACNDPDRWREVVLLAGAKAGGRKGSSFALWALVDELCGINVSDPLTKQQAWGALLAGQAVIETVDYQHLSGYNQVRCDRVLRHLVDLIQQNSLSAFERARAGDTLARLGDPRFDPELFYLPKEDLLGFVHIPAGEFIMGSDPRQDKDAQKSEQPQHKLFLPDYYMARYPVTVAQYSLFVERTHYDKTYEEYRNGPANHPVRYVTWYDARVYCDWLDQALRTVPHLPEELKQRLDQGWKITLPSEAQWEKAARGTDGRLYPWGNEFDANKANMYETGIGTTSAVGCFSLGGGPYGVMDMSDNVNEWTRSLWGKDLEKPVYRYPYSERLKERENLEAGSDILRVVRGGSFADDSGGACCAFRGRFNPPHGLHNFGFRIILSPPLS